jgi:hypothetical protein
MVEFFTARRFNQDTAGAKRSAEDGPVYVTDRGRPSHVLLTFGEYSRLVTASGGSQAGDLLTVLGSDAEAAAVDLDLELDLDLRRARDLPRDIDL